MILPYLNYACKIWGNNFETRLKNLVVLQKRAIRLVDKANYIEHSEPLFAKYKCQKLCDIVHLKTLIITFQAEYNMLPVNLQKMLKTSMYDHKYNTTSCTKVRFCRTKTRSMAISIKSVKLWNDLKIEYYKIKSLQKLKTLLKNVY